MFPKRDDMLPRTGDKSDINQEVSGTYRNRRGANR